MGGDDDAKSVEGTPAFLLGHQHGMMASFGDVTRLRDVFELVRLIVLFKAGENDAKCLFIGSALVLKYRFLILGKLHSLPTPRLL